MQFQFLGDEIIIFFTYATNDFDMKEDPIFLFFSATCQLL